MSKEDYEGYRVLRKERTITGEQRRNRSAKLFVKARQKASAAGMSLVKHSEVHYSLTGPLSEGKSCRWNIYPGNCRLYGDRNYEKPPFLKLPTDWTLMDVVDAAISAWSILDDFENEIAAFSEISISNQVSQRAYYLWEEAGRPSGDGIQFWLQAEKEIRG